MSLSASIRLAGPDDWQGIWPILRNVAAAGDTFTYAIDLDEQAGGDLWSKGNVPSEIFVAIDDARKILGSAKVGANHAGPGGHVATASFIVDPCVRSVGVGRALLDAVLAWAREVGFEAMQFNAVASTNEAAVSLYRSAGFAIVGEIPDAFKHPAKGYVSLLVMHRKL
jgi:ribosomal protein S18 acetylase RimI-like enzyme